MNKIFEVIKRFRRIPLAPLADKLCVYEHLLGFDTEKELGRYHTGNCPGCSIYRKWKCPVCGAYHFLAKEAPGSGGSSGNQREVVYHLPRAEWEGKLPPETAGAVLYVARFTVEDQQKFPDQLTEIVRRLRADGAPVELDEHSQLTYKRRGGSQGHSGHFALASVHQRRMYNGDILYGWHMQPNPETAI